MAGSSSNDPVPAIVIATRNRSSALQQTLEHLLALPEQPEIAVVDNGSADDTVDVVRMRFPSVRLLPLQRNLGGAARTLGVIAVSSDAVAFCDDDSFWQPGALDQARRLFHEHPRLGVVAAKVLLGDSHAVDPTCLAMQRSPLGRTSGLSYPSVLGFIACGSVVRRRAYLEAGGFHPRFGIGGEEELLALDLAAHGWDLAYVHDLVAHHFPSPVRDVAHRREIVTRNALWVSWLRDAPQQVVSRTGRAIRSARRDGTMRKGLKSATAGLPWVLKQRKRLPKRVEDARLTLLSG